MSTEAKAADYCHVKMVTRATHRAPTLCRPDDPGFGLAVAYAEANGIEDFKAVRARVLDNFISARDTYPLCPECDGQMRQMEARR